MAPRGIQRRAGSVEFEDPVLLYELYGLTVLPGAAAWFWLSAAAWFWFAAAWSWAAGDADCCAAEAVEEAAMEVKVAAETTEELVCDAGAAAEELAMAEDLRRDAGQRRFAKTKDSVRLTRQRRR